MRTLIFILSLLAIPAFLYSQDNYFPLQVGDHVTYRATANNDAFLKHTVIDISYNNNRKYYHILRETWNVTTGTPPDTSYIYYQYNPCADFFSWGTSIPALIYIPLATENPVGVDVLNGQHNGQNQTLTVEYVGEVTVPAGTFQDCYKVEGKFGINPPSFPQTRLILAPNVGAISYGLGSGLNNPTNFELVSYVVSSPEPELELVNIDHYHYLPENPMYDEPKIIASSSADNHFSVCADSSFASSFTITSILDENDNPLLDLTTVGIRLKGESQSESILGKLVVNAQSNTSIEVNYRHPSLLPENAGQYNQLSIEIYDLNDGCKIYHTIPLRVYRAPIVLVHGFLGTKKSLEGLKEYLISFGKHPPNHIKIADYEATNTEHFVNNAGVVQESIDELFRIVIEGKTSIGKTDIIAHSMGGILTRLYLQSSDYKDDINKLITLNTPHYGSQIANLILDPSFSFYKRTAICFLLSKYNNGILSEDDICDDGAIEDLQVGSDAIIELVHNVDHPTHIHSIITINNDFSMGYGKIFLEKLELNETSFKLLFSTEENDLIVANISQLGGSAMEASSTFNHIHLNSYNDLAIQEEIDTLLAQNPNSQTFTVDGYAANVLSYQTPEDNGNSPEELEVEIISPIEGQQFSYGENMNIIIQGEQVVENLTVGLFDFENMEDFPSNTANFNHALNPKKLGKLFIKVLATGSGRIATKGTFIVVNTDISPTLIKPSEELISVRVGKRKNPLFIATFPNLGEIFIDGAPGVQYNFKHGYAQHIGEGIIEGISPGEDTLTVTFNGVESEPLRVWVRESTTTHLENRKIIYNNKLQAFPNPTSDFVIAKSFSSNLSDAEFFLTDITGKRISQTIIPFNSGENLTKISMNNLPSGLYFLSLKNEDRIETIKVIKQ